MYEKMQQHLQTELKAIEEAGLYKNERIIVTPQSAEIKVKSGQEVLNFCANNYLGLSDHPAIIEAAHKALDEWGYGLSSVRFICGVSSAEDCCEKRNEQNGKSVAKDSCATRQNSGEKRD